MSAERSPNVVQMPAKTLTSAELVKQALEHLIDARVEAKLRAMGITTPRVNRRALRIGKGYSLSNLAQRAQVSAGYVSMLESGQVRNMGSRNQAGLARICEALGVTVAEYCTAPAAPRK